MHMQHTGTDTGGKFYVEEDGLVAAQIVYAPGGEGIIVIEHTEVSEELRGQNIGYELVKKVADHARQHGLKISPVCPFAKAVFDKRADLKDLLV